MRSTCVAGLPRPLSGGTRTRFVTVCVPFTAILTYTAWEGADTCQHVMKDAVCVRRGTACSAAGAGCTNCVA